MAITKRNTVSVKGQNAQCEEHAKHPYAIPDDTPGKLLPCGFRYMIYVNDQRVSQLTEEDQATICKKFGDALSDYYTRHPEEYANV